MAVATQDTDRSNKTGIFIIACATICTMTMNAIFGLRSSTHLIEMVLLASFSIIMDLLKLIGLRQVFYHMERFAYVKAVLSFVVWTGAVFWCLLSAFGFAGMVRDNTVDTKTEISTKFFDAQKTKSEAQQTIALSKKTEVWTRTSGCSDVTIEESKEFCKRVKFYEKQVIDSDLIMAQGKPPTIDPQAAMLSSFTGFSEKHIRFGITLVFALLAEFTTAFGYVMFTKSRRPDGSNVKTVRRVGRPRKSDTSKRNNVTNLSLARKKKS